MTLRGDKKGIARYRLALRRADRGDCRAYECLIARRMVETFQEADRNLIAAGLPPLVEGGDAA